MKTVCQKYEKNPIITKENIPYPAECVYNAGAVKFKNKYILLLRVLLKNGNSVFGLAESSDGYNFKVKNKPVMQPSDKEPFKTFERKGIEDPRITEYNGEYYIFYSAYSSFGSRIALAKTKDFINYQRIAITTTTDYRNCALFPEKFKGRFARLERPNIQPWGIWISFSPDLIHWGDYHLVMTPYKNHIWEDYKIGPGAPPIKTKKGYLSIYHGATLTMAGMVYRLGCALHDLEDPTKIRGISDTFILSPDRQYELDGYVGNVVFTCGAIPEEDGTVKIYYGGADTCINLATAKINDLIDLCIKGKRPAIG